jgi:hypothetical protein
MPADWVYASNSPVVPGTSVHAYALTPVVLWVVWWSWTTLFAVVLVAAVMGYLQWKGRKPAWVLRKFKCRLRGASVAARPVWYRRRRNRIESYQTLDIGAADRIGTVRPQPTRVPPKPTTKSA